MNIREIFKNYICCNQFTRKLILIKIIQPTLFAKNSVIGNFNRKLLVFNSLFLYRVTLLQKFSFWKNIIFLYFGSADFTLFPTSISAKLIATEILKCFILSFALFLKVIFSEWNRWQNSSTIFHCWILKKI